MTFKYITEDDLDSESAVYMDWLVQDRNGWVLDISKEEDDIILLEHNPAFLCRFREAHYIDM